MKKAFTLLELSIVVGVISILLSMALISREFIANARIKKIIYEINDLETGIKSFYDIYNGLPGDLKNATSFFDSAINGDGDAKVEYSSESYNAMVHLSAADLILGGYAATESDYAFRSSAKLGSVMRLIYTAELEGFLVQNVNVIQLGEANNGNNAIFAPADAERLDSKLDDSRPNTGRVTYRVFGTTTALLCTNNTDDYYVASQTKGCNLVLQLDLQ